MQKYNNSPTLKKKKLVFYLSEKDFYVKPYEPSPRYDIAAKEAKRPTWVSFQTSSWP